MMIFSDSPKVTLDGLFPFIQAFPVDWQVILYILGTMVAYLIDLAIVVMVLAFAAFAVDAMDHRMKRTRSRSRK